MKRKGERDRGREREMKRERERERLYGKMLIFIMTGIRRTKNLEKYDVFSKIFNASLIFVEYS